MGRKNALRIRIAELITSAGLATIHTDRVPPGEMWCIEHTAWEIAKATSGGNTRCRLYVDGHGYKHNIAEQDAPAADTLYTWSKNEYLYPGERWALDIDEAQASTTVEMHLSGYREEIKNA
jgi:hypothetical protein